MCDISPSLEFSGLRVRCEKMGFTAGLSVLVAMRRLQERDLLRDPLCASA